MPERIPQRIDHYRYTDKGVIIEGELSQNELARLAGVVTDNSGNIRYLLEFGIDVLQNRYMRGQIKTQVVLQCQRCLDDYRLDIDTNVALAFVHTDFEAQKAEENALEAFFVDKKELIDPRVLIEDELLLSLPQIPVHPDGDTDDENTLCRVQLDYPPDQTNDEQLTADRDIVDVEQAETENPFAVLKKLQH